MRFVLVLLLALSCPAVAQVQLVITAPSTTIGASASGPQYQVERRLNGIPNGTGSLTVTVSSSSPKGEFNDIPAQQTGWAPTRTLTFASGDTSRPFVYRDGTVGTATLTAQASGYPNATLSVTVVAEIISEDFDGPQLLWNETPVAGRWQFLDLAAGTSNTIAADAVAAHRGDGGLRAVDTASSGAFDAEADLGLNLQAITPQVHFRGWFRMSQPDPVGIETALAVHLAGGNPGLSVDVNTNGNFCLTGHNAAGVYTSAPCTAPVNPDTWRLVEGSLTGLGTDAGVRTLWIDGQQAGTETVDWSGRPIVSFSMGNAWGEPRDFTGTMDWDDFRVTLYPPASTFAVAVPAAVEVGGCAPATVSFVSSSGVAAPAPYDVGAHLLIVNATVSSLSNCSDSIQNVTLPRGSNGSILYLSPTSVGPAKVGAEHPDFLTAVTAFDGVAPGTLSDGGSAGDAGVGDGGTGSADGGSGDGGVAATDGGSADGGGGEGGALSATQPMRVGCGCDQSSGAVLISAVFIGVALARRRRADELRTQRRSGASALAEIVQWLGRDVFEATPTAPPARSACRALRDRPPRARSPCPPR